MQYTSKKKQLTVNPAAVLKSKDEDVMVPDPSEPF